MERLDRRGEEKNQRKEGVERDFFYKPHEKPFTKRGAPGRLGHPVPMIAASPPCLDMYGTVHGLHATLNRLNPIVRLHRRADELYLPVLH